MENDYKQFIEKLGYMATADFVAAVSKKHMSLLTSAMVDSAFTEFRSGQNLPFINGDMPVTEKSKRGRKPGVKPATPPVK